MRNFDHVPSNITQEHIRDSVIEYKIHQIKHPYKDSTDYDVIIDDRPYPPVAIMGIASSLAAESKEYPSLKGGEGTECFNRWSELGFKIVPKSTHVGQKAVRQKPRSWIDCLEVLKYKEKLGYDPRELFSLCLRHRPDYTLNNYLGISASGKASGGSHKFIWSVRDDFSRVEVGFKVKGVGLYLVVDSTDVSFVEGVKEALSSKLKEPFVWPDPQVGKYYRAFVINLETPGQYQSVIDWLSSDDGVNKGLSKLRVSKSAKFKSERPDLFEASSDTAVLEKNTTKLLKEGLDEKPRGNPNPERSDPRESKGAFKRDPEVIAWVKQRANGICELCETDAPFLDKYGNPFLEVHHIIPLADKGPDKVDNAVALCPNCHRECHHGANATSLSKSLTEKLSHQISVA
jgi:hypothetical protein